MHPLVTQELAMLRAQELQREAGSRRLAGEFAARWDHRWRRGLGAQLERWGERLQAGSAGSTADLGRPSHASRNYLRP
jgi:hypothetical protein